MTATTQDAVIFYIRKRPGALIKWIMIGYLRRSDQVVDVLVGAQNKSNSGVHLEGNAPVLFINF